MLISLLAIAISLLAIAISLATDLRFNHFERERQRRRKNR
jgi:hypothetical protein